MNFTEMHFTLLTHTPRSLRFLLDGSTHGVIFLSLLSLFLSIWLLTRKKDWGVLFFCVALYIIPFIMRGY